MTSGPSKDPAFLRHYARVLLREAKARRGTPFATSLIAWAAKARREAQALRKAGPAQPDLFEQAREAQAA
jgi:hypothetical protein